MGRAGQLEAKTTALHSQRGVASSGESWQAWSLGSGVRHHGGGSRDSGICPDCSCPTVLGSPHSFLCCSLPLCPRPGPGWLEQRVLRPASCSQGHRRAGIHTCGTNTWQASLWPCLPRGHPLANGAGAAGHLRAPQEHTSLHPAWRGALLHRPDRWVGRLGSAWGPCLGAAGAVAGQAHPRPFPRFLYAKLLLLLTELRSLKAELTRQILHIQDLSSMTPLLSEIIS